MPSITCLECGETDDQSSDITISPINDIEGERSRMGINCDLCDSFTPTEPWEPMTRGEVAFWKYVAEKEHKEGNYFSLTDVNDDFKAVSEKSQMEFDKLVGEYYSLPVRDGWK